MAKLLSAKWLLIPVAVILIVAAYAGLRYLSHWESTDDAQIEGHIHPLNARIGGTVTSVNVRDNQAVEAGTVLVQLDPRDYQIAVARAEADLAQAQAGVTAARAGVPVATSAAGAQITSSEAIAERAKGGVELAAKELLADQAKLHSAQAHVREAQANATKNARDLERMKQLIAKDEISQQQYDAAVGAADALMRRSNPRRPAFCRLNMKSPPLRRELRNRTPACSKHKPKHRPRRRLRSKS